MLIPEFRTVSIEFGGGSCAIEWIGRAISSEGRFIHLERHNHITKIVNIIPSPCFYWHKEARWKIEENVKCVYIHTMEGIISKRLICKILSTTLQQCDVSISVLKNISFPGFQIAQWEVVTMVLPHSEFMFYRILIYLGSPAWAPSCHHQPD